MVADLNSSLSARYIESRLAEFHRLSHPLLGLSRPGDLQRFVSLLVDSAKGSLLAPEFLDDAVLTQILNYQQQSATDEACWLLFLYCYIGSSGLLNLIHQSWNWGKVIADVDGFERWLMDNQGELKNAGYLRMVHKYQAFDPHRAKAMGEGVKSYITWVKSAGDHTQLFQNMIADCQGQSTTAFDRIYLSMNAYASFKKQIKLDYLCMVSHLKIAGIEPGQFYFGDVLLLKKAARQLFSGHPRIKIPPSELNKLMAALTDCLGSPFSIPVLYRVLIDWGNEIRIPINPNFRRY